MATAGGIMEKMDRTTLAENDGKDGRRALVAYEGKVYDVSDSKRWPKGKHMNRHESGGDLSTDMKAAPHGPEVLLERFEPIAELADESAEDEVQVFWPLSWVFEKFPILKRHAHPVAVHFPIAGLVAAFVFAALGLITGHEAFGATSFHMLIFGTVLAPLALVTGIQSWWLYYGLYKSPGIITKLVGGPVMILLGIVAIYLYATAGLTIAFAGLTLAITVLALFLGYIGGQMMIPD
jgi:predicted heme/steroid binding protein/uncharacterized membrane protein